MSGPTEQDEVARVFRDEYGAAVATLVRSLGDIDLAEEAVADAFSVAVARWPRDGVPPRPGGWIVTTARRRALDRLRRESVRDAKQTAAVRRLDREPEESWEEGAVRDDRLRLLFTCAHPALAVPARVALTLRLLGGLSTAEVARGFLVPESTMAQRLVRAKATIARAGVPYRVPTQAELPERLPAVLAVVYLIFTEGHTGSGDADAVRPDLCREAVRLARLLVELMPDEPEVLGLLALLLLSEARRPARLDPDGGLVPLPEQDRTRWDRELIAEGHELVRRCLRRDLPGCYQLQAAINAVHTDAAHAEETDWRQIVALYDRLTVLDPGPVAALNRAVAVAEVDGPRAGLNLLDGLELARYHLFHAVRADLLARLGRVSDADTAYAEALTRTDNPAERRLIERRRHDLALDPHTSGSASRSAVTGR